MVTTVAQLIAVPVKTEIEKTLVRRAAKTTNRA